MENSYYNGRSGMDYQQDMRRVFPINLLSGDFFEIDVDEVYCYCGMTPPPRCEFGGNGVMVNSGSGARGVNGGLVGGDDQAGSKLISVVQLQSYVLEKFYGIDPCGNTCNGELSRMRQEAKIANQQYRRMMQAECERTGSNQPAPTQFVDLISHPSQISLLKIRYQEDPSYRGSRGNSPRDDRYGGVNEDLLADDERNGERDQNDGESHGLQDRLKELNQHLREEDQKESEPMQKLCSGDEINLLDFLPRYALVEDKSFHHDENNAKRANSSNSSLSDPSNPSNYREMLPKFYLQCVLLQEVFKLDIKSEKVRYKPLYVGEAKDESVYVEALSALSPESLCEKPLDLSIDDAIFVLTNASLEMDLEQSNFPGEVEQSVQYALQKRIQQILENNENLAGLTIRNSCDNLYDSCLRDALLWNKTIVNLRIQGTGSTSKPVHGVSKASFLSELLSNSKCIQTLEIKDWREQHTEEGNFAQSLLSHLKSAQKLQRRSILRKFWFISCGFTDLRTKELGEILVWKKGNKALLKGNSKGDLKVGNSADGIEEYTPEQIDENWQMLYAQTGLSSPGILELNLQRNAITSKGVCELAQSIGKSSLKNVNLANNKVDEEAIKSLKQALKENKHLPRIYIGHEKMRWVEKKK